MGLPAATATPHLIPFYKRVPETALRPIAGLSRSAQLTFIQLHRLVLSRTGACHYQIDRIAAELGMSRRELQRDLSELLRHGCDCSSHTEHPRQHRGLILRDGRALRVEGVIPGGASSAPASGGTPGHKRIRPAGTGRRPQGIAPGGGAVERHTVAQLPPPHIERSSPERSLDLRGEPTHRARRLSKPERARWHMVNASDKPKEPGTGERARGPSKTPRALPEKILTRDEAKKRIATILDVTRERDRTARELAIRERDARAELRKAELTRQGRELLNQELLDVLHRYLAAHEARSDWMEVLS